jgi:hypothetical protein
MAAGDHIVVSDAFGVEGTRWKVVKVASGGTPEANPSVRAVCRDSATAAIVRTGLDA